MILVKHVTKEDWKPMAVAAHGAVFSEEWDADMERIDKALITVDQETDMLLQYATLREIDSESVYISYGGSFPSAKGSPRSLESFVAILEDLKKSYKRVVFLTENINFPMLKLALKTNFVITGMRQAKGRTMLEHVLEFGG